jgi:hypothetical protein
MGLRPSDCGTKVSREEAVTSATSSRDFALLTSGMVADDCDDPAFLDTVTGRYGPTPIVSQSPRGGRDFYYRPRDDVRLGNRVRIAACPSISAPKAAITPSNVWPRSA